MHVASAMTPDPIVIGPSASVADAARAMDRAEVRHLVVVEDGRVLGVISERDLLSAAREDELPVRRVFSAPAIAIGPDDPLVAAAVVLTGRAIGCLPVIAGERLVGILTEIDLLDAFRAAVHARGAASEIDPPASSRMRSHPTTIGSGATLEEALALCRSNGIRHLPVLRDGELAGILSDRDLRRAVGAGQDGSTPVDELMTSPVRCIGPRLPLAEAAGIMIDRRLSALPVVDRDRLVGILTSTDLVEHCLDALREPDA